MSELILCSTICLKVTQISISGVVKGKCRDHTGLLTKARDKRQSISFPAFYFPERCYYDIRKITSEISWNMRRFNGSALCTCRFYQIAQFPCGSLRAESPLIFLEKPTARCAVFKDDWGRARQKVQWLVPRERVSFVSSRPSTSPRETLRSRGTSSLFPVPTQN